ncbi:MAG: thioesterase family protein [Bacteroidales bacterium]|nr:thioesterase family protein [Bacteroidales bacterium]
MKIGVENVIEHKVNEADLATSYGSGSLNVFATPAMITYMEKSAFELAQAQLEEGDTTVGISVEINHKRASAIGMRINTVARLINIDKNKLTFEVEAYDVNGLIGYGIHKRFIVNEIEFMADL